ncbi:MAG: hypothetical protein KGI25_03715 [Thaumarchaeota archaeon]|nr:hypothetical protein [Nitrososphaerota archaeon]
MIIFVEDSPNSGPFTERDILNYLEKELKWTYTEGHGIGEEMCDIPFRDLPIAIRSYFEIYFDLHSKEISYKWIPMGYVNLVRRGPGINAPVKNPDDEIKFYRNGNPVTVRDILKSLGKWPEEKLVAPKYPIFKENQ